MSPAAACPDVSARGQDEWCPTEVLRAKLGRLTALRDRGLLSSEELTVATARLLGL